MRLFDDYDSHDDNYSRRAESYCGYLNRSSRPEATAIRDVLENWFNRYPDDGRSELRSQFRSPHNRQHLGSFFELLLHELLTRNGCKIALHPEIYGTTSRPDFLVTNPEGTSFILEATICSDQDQQAVAETARINTVYDALNELESPNFFLWVDSTALDPSNPPGVVCVASLSYSWTG